MKNNKKKLSFALVLLVILGLIGSGMALGIRGVLAHAPAIDQAEPLEMMASGGLLVAGVLLAVFVLLYTRSRDEKLSKELDMLREKEAAVEALNRQTQELAHHQRLEIIGTLTSSIAHEFNNLLTPIMGYSLMSMEALAEQESEIYENLLEIYSASRKAKQIISRLSDLSRKHTQSNYHLVSPDELIRKTLDMATPAKPEAVEIKLDLACWDQRIPVNEIQISQLLLNLILNAFQAMETAGGILTVSSYFDETHIHIRIADTGCGIAPDILPKIFDPFFTTKGTGKGTGLGLAIAAQMAEDHQGTIRVESTPGQGAVFTTSLPRTREE